MFRHLRGTNITPPHFNPFTPESDQCQNSPAAPPEILHHTVRRTWLIIAYSDERWLYYEFLLPYLYIFSLKGWENGLFELRSERVKNAFRGASFTTCTFPFSGPFLTNSFPAITNYSENNLAHAIFIIIFACCMLTGAWTNGAVLCFISTGRVSFRGNTVWGNNLWRQQAGSRHVPSGAVDLWCIVLLMFYRA